MIKTHCPKGHEYSEENTYTDKNGYKHCRTCARERMRESRPRGPGRGSKNKAKTHCPQGHSCRQCYLFRHRILNVTKHGITPEQKSIWLEKNDFRCEICGLDFLDTKEKICIDHDHRCCPGNFSCGDCIRGMLCLACNRLLGDAKDNIPTLASAILYLDRNTKN